MQVNDPARAAEMYELADDLAPSAAALRNAARARLAAGHTATAATLAAQLLQRYSNEKDSRRVAEAILGELAPKLGQLEITCSEECTLTLEGKAASSSKARTVHTLYVQPGARTLGATFSANREEKRQLTVRAGSSTPIRMDAPPLPAPVVAPSPTPDAQPVVSTPLSHPSAEPPPRRIESHGIGRTWFVVSAVVTVGLGAGATWQGITTMKTRDEIEAANDAGNAPLASSLYDRGRSEQLRTNILIGATAAAGITTVVLGLVTNWSGESERREIAIKPTDGGAAFVVGGRF